MKETYEERKERFDRETKALGTNNRVQQAADAIERGDHLYYGVKEGTNIRHSVGDDPIIYTSLEGVLDISGHAYVPMKVSDYNEMFGRFMTNGGK